MHVTFLACLQLFLPKRPKQSHDAYNDLEVFVLTLSVANSRLSKH